MMTLFRCDTVCPMEDIRSTMAAHIRQLPAKVSIIGNTRKVLRLELVSEPINILAWLHNQKSDTKLYWSDREGRFEMGGIGIAENIKGNSVHSLKELFAAMEERLSQDNPLLRFYGGLSFNYSTAHVEWDEFGAYQFIIPQFEWLKTEDQTVFAMNIAFEHINEDNIKSILDDLRDMNFALETTYRKVPQILNRKDSPNKEEWMSIFARAQSENGKRNFEKIVLARKSTFQFDVSLRPEALLKHLKDRTPHCFHFCFQISPSSAFIGSSPERLFQTRRDGADPLSLINTEAIAGTRPRGVNEEEDTRLENELLHSQKDAEEHKFVVDAIRNTLDPLCSTLTADETFSLRKLKGSQHLITRIQGELVKAVYDYQILESLHPTPAVAGCPTQAAIIAIEQLEPFNRGWYTGPVGYVGYNHCEFAVAIRCGLVHKNELSLYAGAGIVRESRCEDEWDEIENKISNFMRVFETTS